MYDKYSLYLPFSKRYREIAATAPDKDTISGEDDEEEATVSYHQSWNIYTWKSITTVTVTLVCVACVFAIVLFLPPIWKQPNLGGVALENFLSKGPPVLTTFEKTVPYNLPSSEESDRAWHNMPQEFVALPVSQRKQLGLNPGFPDHHDPSVEHYGIAAYHELHCLSMIRDVHFNLLSSAPIDNETQHHIGHCFDYLRQAIICCADSTLEWPSHSRSGQLLGNIDGWGVTHRCRDFNAIGDYIEKNNKN